MKYIYTQVSSKLDSFRFGPRGWLSGGSTIYFFTLFAIFSLAAKDPSQIYTIAKTEGVLSSRQLAYYKDLFGANSFIETGTYAGDTTAEAAQVFQEVHSIEIWEPLYKAAQNRFRFSPNVTLYLGDTSTLLSQMIKNSSPKRLYWLDAHCSGGGTGGEPGFNPVLDELHQIFEIEKDIHSIVLIDDLRGMCHCDQRTNLPLRQIMQKIKASTPDLRFYSLGDIGIIFNARSYPNIAISEIVEKATLSRCFDPACEEEAELEKLIEAEAFIGSVNEGSDEGKTFCNLAKWVDNKANLGGEVIYLLWESLREIERNEFSSAISDLELISHSFYSHWRVDAYLIRALILDGQIDRAISQFNQKLLRVYAKHPRLIEKILKETFPCILKHRSK